MVDMQRLTSKNYRDSPKENIELCPNCNSTNTKQGEMLDDSGIWVPVVVCYVCKEVNKI